ncbi:hypothetical protein [Streptomyces sp. A5-4]|uniref:hypothetical protein n=1 Tax=Streptomyces sp. A5-4 TaxID=3384771 RepID=UPI003DA8F72C
MRSPSVPGDLDRVERVWSRAAALAVATAMVGDGDRFKWADGALHCENAGGAYWWRLQMFDGGRAVLCGQDSDASHTHLVEPPVDLLAGGPDWLPWEGLRHEAKDRVLGYVYWWEDGSWGRAPYPQDVEDDGLEASVPWAGIGEEARRELVASMVAVTEPDCDPAEAVARFLTGVQARAVDEAAIAALVEELCRPRDRERADMAAALTLAAELGVSSGQDVG